MKFPWWKNIIFLAVLTLILAGPLWGGGVPDSGPVAFTDYGSFLGEYQAAGAFKFYENTEAMLRLAQFEHALMRYRFLKGQIQRSGDYHGLSAMVGLRLRFLKKQMHLTNRDIAAIPPRKARIPKAKPPEAKTTAKKDAAAKRKTPGSAAEDKKPALAIPVKEINLTGKAPPGAKTSPPEKTTAPPVAAATPVPAAQNPKEVVTTTETKEEKAEEETEKTKSAPPPGFWERLKIRLRLKKRAD